MSTSTQNNLSNTKAANSDASKNSRNDWVSENPHANKLDVEQVTNCVRQTISWITS